MFSRAYLLAVAIAIVVKAGTLHVTHALNGPELGKAPHAQKNSITYLAVYASAGNEPAVTHPIAPRIDEPKMCRPRALCRSADHPRNREKK